MFGNKAQKLYESGYANYSDQRYFLDASIQEAFHGEDDNKLDLLQSAANSLATKYPMQAPIYAYHMRRATIRSVVRYSESRYNPMPVIPFLPLKAAEHLTNSNGYKLVESWRRIFSGTLLLFEKYDSANRIFEPWSEDFNWYDHNELLRAQVTTISALGNKACVNAQIETPLELNQIL